MSTLLRKVPREIWEIILLHLPVYEDLVVASLTCHLWRNILAEHLVCPSQCTAVAHGWKVDQPFVYNFLPGTPPSEKGERLPLDLAVNHWVTWPHIPLCFEVVLRDRRERGPRFKSKAHYGLSVGWAFKGLIPYTEKERRMDVDNSRTGEGIQTLALSTPAAKVEQGEPMAVVPVTAMAGHGGGCGGANDRGVNANGEREPKRARSLEAGLTESQEMERRAQLSDDIQQAWQVLGLSGVGGGAGEDQRQQRNVDVERLIVRVGGPPEKKEGQFPFYAKQLFMLRGERLKAVVSSLVDEVRRERRNEENVPMVGLIVERAKDEENAVTATGAGSGALMREGEWRCVRGRSDRREECAAGDCDDNDNAMAAGSESNERKDKEKEKEKEKGKSYMAGFYIPNMDKYAFGTDTLVFELHVKVGGVHIPSSPFLLAFFNPLLP